MCMLNVTLLPLIFSMLSNLKILSCHLITVMFPMLLELTINLLTYLKMDLYDLLILFDCHFSLVY
ncbi:hypothetical protein MUK42_21312 [Musa troglodytarum]|uniref:Uncharacterized protein n=1 Tax=Musa troglodytarum TaxID=320322 RepID=A0A9E7KE96_9LILI|nr:hypothetical protein MUK42_21312 [Musa troglodytarum]